MLNQGNTNANKANDSDNKAYCRKNFSSFAYSKIQGQNETLGLVTQLLSHKNPIRLIASSRTT